MAAKAGKKPAVKRKANGYKMPEHFNSGEILEDTGKVKWKLGSSIGIGGFGEIYSASKAEEKSSNYVIKIEPIENGPLFCEKNVYLRIGKKEDIDEYVTEKKLKSFGMPQFHGFGSHIYNGANYRFLVMQRYGNDLWSLFLSNGKTFPPQTVFQVGIQILDVLEYIHSKMYVHADIKGANLLLGRGQDVNQVYLVDLGLACKYPLTDFKPDPRKAHNGTLEYTSRDAHVGAPTRRGDIEILGYNMLMWMCSRLPWEKLKDPATVHMEKTKYLDNIQDLMENSFKGKQHSGALKSYFLQLSKMKPLDEPDYKKLRKILLDGVKEYGSLGEKLNFESKVSKKTAKSPVKIKKENGLKEAGKVVKKKILKRRSVSSGPSPAQKVLKKGNPTGRSWRDCPTIVNGAKGVKTEEQQNARAERARKRVSKTP